MHRTNINSRFAVSESPGLVDACFGVLGTGSMFAVLQYLEQLRYAGGCNEGLEESRGLCRPAGQPLCGQVGGGLLQHELLDMKHCDFRLELLGLLRTSLRTVGTFWTFGVLNV